jgi:hypothetical protein
VSTRGRHPVGTAGAIFFGPVEGRAEGQACLSGKNEPSGGRYFVHRLPIWFCPSPCELRDSVITARSAMIHTVIPALAAAHCRAALAQRGQSRRLANAAEIANNRSVSPSVAQCQRIHFRRRSRDLHDQFTGASLPPRRPCATRPITTGLSDAHEKAPPKRGSS